MIPNAYFCCTSKLTSGNQIVVLGMRSYPEPEDAVRHVHAERTIVQANAHGTEAIDALEAKGRMRGIGFEELKALVGQGANSLRECLIALPEAR